MTGLAERSLKGLVWNLSGRFSQQVVSLLVDLVLARMLAPEDFGTVGLALAIVHISKLPVSLGSASALVQLRNGSPLQHSSVFYFNLTVAAVLFCLVELAAGPIASLYGDHRLEGVLRWTGAVIPIYALNIVQQAILRGKLDFRKLAVRGMAAELLGASAGLAAVLSGWGIMALVVKHVTAESVSTLMLWWHSSWYPQWEFSVQELRTVLSTGVRVFMAQSTDVMLKRAVALTVGGAYGTYVLGLMNRAEALNTVVTGYVAAAVKDVSFPLLSSLHDERERFGTALLKMLHVVSFLSFGLTGLMYFSGEDVVALLLGAKWLPAVAIFQWLAFRAPALASDGVISFGFLAAGRIRDYIRYDAAKKALNAAALLAALVAPFNLFLIVLVAASVIIWVLNSLVLAGELGLSMPERVLSCIPYTVIFAGSMVTMHIATSGMDGWLFSHIVRGLLFLTMFIVLNAVIGTAGFRLVTHHGVKFLKGLRKS